MALLKAAKSFSKSSLSSLRLRVLVSIGAVLLSISHSAKALPFALQAPPHIAQTSAYQGRDSDVLKVTGAEASSPIKTLAASSAKTPKLPLMDEQNARRSRKTPSLQAADKPLFKVATFDSGFGGYFTAKEIEKRAAELSQNSGALFQISHYGDTLNLPYGEKTFEQIAKFSATGILKAFRDGAEKVYIACNTASTQLSGISELLEKKQKGLSSNIVSIIDVSTKALKTRIDKKLESADTARVLIFATPATLKAKAYPKALAKSYGLKLETLNIKTLDQPRWYQAKSKTVPNAWGKMTLNLQNRKTIELTFIGPGNWVDLIERGAETKIKEDWIKKDLAFFKLKNQINTSHSFDVVGEFCTHYPAIHELIVREGRELALFSDKTDFIKQGPLMGDLFTDFYGKKLKAAKPDTIHPSPPARAKIYISGPNVEETRELVRKIFPVDPLPEIKQIEFK